MSSFLDEQRKAAKQFAKTHQDITVQEFERLLQNYFGSSSFEARNMGAELLMYMPKQRGQLDPRLVSAWLEKAESWGDVDSLCYQRFSAEDVLANVTVWKKLLYSLAESDNVFKKRASLVLLTKPVKTSSEPVLAILAFDLIEKLQSEKNPLVTKAVSWLLRNLTSNHRALVENYLEKNIANLPSVAIRETRNKLRTGRK